MMRLRIIYTSVVTQRGLHSISLKCLVVIIFCIKVSQCCLVLHFNRGFRAKSGGSCSFWGVEAHQESGYRKGYVGFYKNR